MWRCTSVAAVQRLKNTDLQDKTKGWIEAAAAAGGGGARKSFVLPVFPYRPPALVYALNIFPFLFFMFFLTFLYVLLFIYQSVFFLFFSPFLPACLPAPLPALLLLLAGGWEKKK